MHPTLQKLQQKLCQRALKIVQSDSKLTVKRCLDADTAEASAASVAPALHEHKHIGRACMHAVATTCLLRVTTVLASSAIA